MDLPADPLSPRCWVRLNAVCLSHVFFVDCFLTCSSPEVFRFSAGAYFEPCSLPSEQLSMCIVPRHPTINNVSSTLRWTSQTCSCHQSPGHHAALADLCGPNASEYMFQICFVYFKLGGNVRQWSSSGSMVLFPIVCCSLTCTVW